MGNKVDNVKIRFRLLRVDFILLLVLHVVHAFWSLEKMCKKQNYRFPSPSAFSEEDKQNYRLQTRAWLRVLHRPCTSYYCPPDARWPGNGTAECNDIDARATRPRGLFRRTVIRRYVPFVLHDRFIYIYIFFVIFSFITENWFSRATNVRRVPHLPVFPLNRSDPGE